jgi:hypothetical protein
MNISDQFKQMTVCLNKYRFVPAPEKLAVIVMKTIVTLGIYTIQMTHKPGQVPLGSLSQNMVVIVHQAKTTDPNIPEICCFFQQPDKILPIYVISKDRISPAAPVHKMIPGSGVFYT